MSCVDRSVKTVPEVDGDGEVDCDGEGEGEGGTTRADYSHAYC